MQLILFIVFWASLSHAKTLQTPFWHTSYSEDIELQIKALEPGIEKDCQEYRDFIFDDHHNLKALDAAELENARSLPLAGMMQNRYKATFVLKAAAKNFSDGQVAEYLLEDSTFINNPVVGILSESLESVKPAGEGWLTKVSAQSGLVPTLINLKKNDESDYLLIEVHGRDIACDLIQRKVQLSAKAKYTIGLRAADILKLNALFTRIEDVTFAVLQSYETAYERSAALGYRYGNFFDRKKNSQVQREEKIKNLYHNLFVDDSFEFSENWKKSDNCNIIFYPKSKISEYGSVIISI